jgi:hypothetical protein
VVLPVLLVAAALAREATDLYGRVQSGDLDFIRFFQPVFDALQRIAPHGCNFVASFVLVSRQLP